jgi:transcriptional regulator with PAS, ATPase and Fis domain
MHDSSLSGFPVDEKLGFKIIGKSKKMQELYQTIKKIADAPNVPIIILGESGTGKELVARAIHSASPAADKPFIEINCSALPETLLESEIFGYEKGAFTDAKTLKRGLLELADGGSFFLDEIADMSFNLQVKLLRAIELKTFKRVGGVKDIVVTMRIIAATNKNLEKEVEKGRFREDLFFRLNVISLTVPPLRDREGDVELLAQYFLSQYNKEYKHNIKGFSPQAIELLHLYPWPGNVRELKNVIERVVLLETPKIIEPHHLKLGDGHLVKNYHGSAEYADSIDIDIPPKGLDLDNVEKILIEKALNKAKGNQTKAAGLLHISRQTLRYRMKKYKIS